MKQEKIAIDGQWFYYYFLDFFYIFFIFSLNGLFLFVLELFSFPVLFFLTAGFIIFSGFFRLMLYYHEENILMVKKQTSGRIITRMLVFTSCSSTIIFLFSFYILELFLHLLREIHLVLMKSLQYRNYSEDKYILLYKNHFFG